jgi:hypothetical protein
VSFLAQAADRVSLVANFREIKLIDSPIFRVHEGTERGAVVERVVLNINGRIDYTIVRRQRKSCELERDRRKDYITTAQGETNDPQLPPPEPSSLQRLRWLPVRSAKFSKGKAYTVILNDCLAHWQERSYWRYLILIDRPFYLANESISISGSASGIARMDSSSSCMCRKWRCIHDRQEGISGVCL